LDIETIACRVVHDGWVLDGEMYSAGDTVVVSTAFATDLEAEGIVELA
jgi:hypothetical protein